MPPRPSVDPTLAAQIATLTKRLRGPDRDAELEARLGRMTVPVLAVFGTRDGVIPPEMGRLYKDLIPDAHLVFVYDAGHAIAAERPEAFVEVVSDFLERADAFVISRVKTVILP
jgi:pimeloyl-ACP methyl ester carboxylesterase